MSRHFNYEIDERRLKKLLSENSMSYSEDLWNDYLEKTKPLEKINRLPTFNPSAFAINKSVLLTIVFVVLIGSFTLLIAKFVDFSNSRSNIETVRQVIPDASNYTPIKKKLPLPPPTPKQAISVPDTAKYIIATQEPSVSSTPSIPQAIQQEKTIVITPTPGSPIKEETKIAARIKPDSTAQSLPNDTSKSSSLNAKKGPTKKGKKQFEVMESKPISTDLMPITNKEPELELK